MIVTLQNVYYCSTQQNGRFTNINGFNNTKLRIEVGNNMRYRFLRFPKGRAKAVTLSYDDGCPEDIRFSDTITKYGLKCTFNLNCDAMRKENLSAIEIKEHFLSKGHEIAVHGANHRAEGTLRPVDGIQEVLECRLELERKFGIIVRGMAYPDSGITKLSNGASYEKIKQYLTDLDIVYSRSLGGDNDEFVLPNDWHAWMPTAHHINPKIMEYIDKFLNIDLSQNAYGTRREPRLFYLWGHSYEFERNNNWKLLEDICINLSGKSDIWYATNMEIYEYVNAYNSLIYSANGKIVYNPTLLDIWFDVDGKEYKISSGETLNIE